MAKRDEFGVTNDVVQLAEAHFGQIFAHLLRQEAEVVHHILVVTAEVLAQFGVLRGYTHRAGVGVALAHHHAAQHNEHRGAEAELLSTEQSHGYDVAAGLDLAVGLQAHLAAQAVEHERLLCFAQTYFGRNASVTHAAGGRSTRTALSTADDDEVGLSLGHTCCNSAYAAFGHQLHAHLGLGVHILEVEDELSQVFNRIDVVVRRGRNERDAWDGVARAGNDFVDLIAGQLAALAGLGTLSHLNLYFLSIHQILRGHAEAARSNLLGFAAKRNAVEGVMEAFAVLAALARVAARAELVHGQSQSLVGFLANGAERHSTRHEVLHEVVNRLHFVNGYGIFTEFKEVAQEDGVRLVVDEVRKFLELLVTAQPRGQLQRGNGFGVPGVLLAILAVGEKAGVRKHAIEQAVLVGGGKAFVVQQGVVAGNLVETYATNAARLGAEVAAQEFFAQTHSLEYLGAAVGADGADAHFRHHLIEPLADGLDVVLLGRVIVHLHFAALHQVVEYGKGHVGIDGAGAVAQQQGSVHHFAYFAALDNECRLHTLLHRDEVMVHGTHGQQGGYDGMLGIHAAVAQHNVVHTIEHALLSLAAEFAQGFLQTGTAFLHLEEHGQLHRFETLIADVAKQVELAVVEHGMRQAHHFAMALIGHKNVHAHGANVFGQRHDQFLADGVDGGVGDLGKLLAEVVEEQLRTLRKHGKRRVVTHRGHGFAAVVAHGHNGTFDVLAGKAEYAEFAGKVVDGIFHLTAALEGVELNAVGREPLAIRLGCCQLLLEFAIVIDAALLRIDQKDFARLQTAFFLDVACLEIDDACLGGYHHHVVLRDEVTGGAQTVAVEHTARITSVAEEQGGRTVPRLHQDRVIFVESLEILADGVLVVEALRHQHGHGMRQTQARHHHELKHVVE